MIIIETYLKRNVYDRLLSWKSQSDHKTLEVSGARQVGKTYIVRKFAEEQYEQNIYISLSDLSGELFLKVYYGLIKEMEEGKTRPINPVYELIKRYDTNFMDSKDTVVIIDEIQESADIYNRIREFTRNLKCDFIVTGSYLGRIINKNFRFSAGDMDSLEIQTLSFQEFLNAVGQYPLYEELDLYGSSREEVYAGLEHWYIFTAKLVDIQV